jgi:peptide/nickel transport system substrate-binding protein
MARTHWAGNSAWTSRGEIVADRRLTRRRIIGAAAAGGAVGLLAACGRGGSAPSSKVTSGPSAPRPGGTFTMRLPDDIVSFDISTNAKNEANELALAFSRLVRFKYGPDVKYADLTLEPEVADKWELPDPQTYTLHMRPGVNFANLPPVNGRALTASDLKFSYEYATRSGQVKEQSKGKTLLPAQYNWMLEGLDRIETPDDSTVVVKFQQPFAPFLNYAATCSLSILPHEIYDQDGDFKRQIVGSGPFQFDRASSQNGTRSVWKKNPTYWETGKPYFDEFVYVIIKDPSTAYAAFQAKQLDFFSGATMSATDVEQMKRNNPDATVYPYIFFGAQDIWMNQMPGKLLADQRLRKGISMAIDRDEMISTLGGGKGQWSLGGAFPGTLSQDETKQLLKHDVDQARQMVAAAGYPNGVEVEFQYTTDYGPFYISMIQLLQAQLKKAGLNIVFKVLDRQDTIQRRKNGDYIMSATAGDVNTDIDSSVYQKYLPGSTGNNSRVDDPELTALITAQRREVDPEKRKQIIQQAVRRIATTAEGLTTFYAEHNEFWRPSLKNYAPNFGNPGSESAPHMDSAWRAQ